jgi:hypothetical protein
MDNITITKSLYRRLIERDDFLSCLEDCGVDNWDGYSEAQSMKRDFTFTETGLVTFKE